MIEEIEIGHHVFLSDGGEEVGAVRALQRDAIVVWVENSGDWVVPREAIKAVHSQKVVLDRDRLDDKLREAIERSHEGEQPGL